MKFSQVLKVTAALAIAGLVDADCTLENQITDAEKKQETRTAVCQPQGRGDWTFTMINSMVSVPTFDGQNPFAGIAGNDAFIVHDHNCVPQGVYGPDEQGNDCGIPYVINDGYMPFPLKITNINMGLGGGDFKFDYADGTYEIGANHCTCTDISGDGLRAEQACKCAFPVFGNDMDLCGDGLDDLPEDVGSEALGRILYACFGQPLPDNA